MNKIDPERPVMQERSEVSRFDCVCISVFGVQNGGEARALGSKVLYEPNWSFSTVLIHKQAKFSYGCHTCQYIHHNTLLRSWFNLQEINEKWSILSEM